MAAPVYQTAGTAVIGSGTSPTAGNEPTSSAQDNFIFAVFGITGTATPTEPAGWTVLKSGASPSTTFRYIIAWINRGASAPSYSFTYTPTTSVYRELMTFRVTGQNLAAPIDAEGTLTSGTGNTGVNQPPVTAVSSEALAVAVLIHWGGSSGGWTAPSGYTLRSNNTAGNDIAVATKTLAASGVEDPASWDAPASNAAWIAHTFTIAPTAAAAETPLLVAAPPRR